MAFSWAFVTADDEPSPLLSINKTLRGLPDLERGITRILHRTAAPAEFVTILRALASIAANCQLQASVGADCVPSCHIHCMT